MTPSPFRKYPFIKTAFARRFQAMVCSAWHNRSWHVIVADPGAGKTTSIRDLQKRAGGRSVLAVVTPKNNDDEQALGDQFFAALGVPIRGHWSTRKPKLMHSPLNKRHKHHPGKRGKRSLSHRPTARFLELFPFPSSVSSRVVSRWWNVLAVGEHGLFRQAVECCVSKRTPNGKRTLPMPGDGGPGGKGKQTGMWLAENDDGRRV